MRLTLLPASSRATQCDVTIGLPPGFQQVVPVGNWDSLRVSWAAPTRSNGQLTQYVLKQLDPGGNGTISVPANTKQYTLKALHPYQRYSFELSACNKAGCSEPSAEVSGRTRAGPPGAMEPPRTQLLNASAVRVSWRRPAVAGGPQPVYTLRTVSERRGVNTTTSHVLPNSAHDGKQTASGDPQTTRVPAHAVLCLTVSDCSTLAVVCTKLC